MLFNLLIDRDIFANIFNENIGNEVPNTCNHNFTIVDGYHTCTLCGIIDIHRHTFMEQISSPSKGNRNMYLYHRKSYFRERLRLMVGIKQSVSPIYSSIITDLKNQEFTSIIELKRI